jgi:hypothetical protein
MSLSHHLAASKRIFTIFHLLFTTYLPKRLWQQAIHWILQWIWLPDDCSYTQQEPQKALRQFVTLRHKIRYQTHKVFMQAYRFTFEWFEIFNYINVFVSDYKKCVQNIMSINHIFWIKCLSLLLSIIRRLLWTQSCHNSLHKLHITRHSHLTSLLICNCTKYTCGEFHLNCSAVEIMATNILRNIRRGNLLLSFEVKCHIQGPLRLSFPLFWLWSRVWCFINKRESCTVNNSLFSPRRSSTCQRH